jgi:hypothetical protein
MHSCAVHDLTRMNENEVTAIVEQLAQHLRQHPLACDSAVGIAQWWLPQEPASSQLLEQALAWLVRYGALVEIVGQDGRRRFRRAGDDQALAAAVAARADALGRPWQ